MTPVAKGLAAVSEAVRTAKPGRWLIDEQTAALDLFAEMAGDLVAAALTGVAPPDQIAAVLFRLAVTAERPTLRAEHLKAVATAAAARRAVVLTPSPSPLEAEERARAYAARRAAGLPPSPAPVSISSLPRRRRRIGDVP